MNRFIARLAASLLGLAVSSATFAASQVYTPGTIPASSTLVGGSGSSANMALPVTDLAFYVSVFGAKGNGVTDDTAAIQTAINDASLFGGGTVLFSGGNYCTFTGISVTAAPVRLVGVGQDASSISSCAHDATVVTLNSYHAHLENIDVVGKGSNNDTGTFGATNPAIVLGPNCVECLIIDVSAFGGSNILAWQAGEAYVYRFKGEDYYGTSMVYVTGGGWGNRLKLDQQWPRPTPCTNATVNAWAATTSYTASQCATLGGFFIQAMTTGTSGGTAPTLKNYQITFSDGSTSWQIAAPAAGYDLQMDTGSIELYVSQLDASGAGRAGFAMTNTLSGNAPSAFKCVQCIASQEYTEGFLFTAGAGAYLTDVTASCFGSNCAGINFTSPWSGNVSIEGGYAQNMPFGLSILSGGRYTIRGLDVSGSTTAGIEVQNNVSDFALIGNIANGAAIGYQTQNTADYYNIIGNICGPTTTTCVSDAASGTHKTVSGNN